MIFLGHWIVWWSLKFSCQGDLLAPSPNPTRLPLVCVLSHFSRVWLFETLRIVAYQVPLSMGFFRQEYWSGLPFLRGSSQPRDWAHISCGSCIAGGFFTAEPPGDPWVLLHRINELHWWIWQREVRQGPELLKLFKDTLCLTAEEDHRHLTKSL